MAQPARSPLPAPEPAYRAAETFDSSGRGDSSGKGPVAELQQMLAARIADWPRVGDPFQEGPRQQLDEIVSAVSRAAGYACFAGAVAGIGILFALWR